MFGALEDAVEAERSKHRRYFAKGLFLGGGMALFVDLLALGLYERPSATSGIGAIIVGTFYWFTSTES